MANLTVDTLEQLRQHFNKAPYPNVPLELYPDKPNSLYIHNLTTAYYRRNQRVISPVGRVILDAGCGTGFKSLELAIANPGAKIVGIDISEDSVVMARQRLAYHKIDNVEFHAIPVEQLAQLDMQFDYINCDDVLYLVPDPIKALQNMRSVLKPEGIIRANFHSETGRRLHRVSQEFFRMLGCMQGPPEASEIELVRQVMGNLIDGVTLLQTWNKEYFSRDELVLANHLLQNDKSWSIHQFFAALKSADLEFVNMVDWWSWNLADLFNNVEELPLEVVMRLAELSIEDQLALYESMNVLHRLLDVWSGHPGQSNVYTPIEDWSDTDWYGATVHFHPQLLSAQFKQDFLACVSNSTMFNTEGYLRTTTAFPTSIFIDSVMTGCLLPLLDGARSFQDLLNRRMHLQPINPVTMEPVTPELAFLPLKQILTQLENMGYVMLECSK
ncbi:methyltransferase domain-containing protein [filamentous cyanobacterium LEGE 11480]|uniref:Methyltransferase domain-containing protein n=1 Tax=Romeriopsis navalis LEGE 11480 TaxID=2777977 RepID=A0A928VSL0_9CYAN|nr:methyltransferase domain-containing protein [Romeriopsis navalis]MBE9031454.1 methyltransferase domain-containing protein [Romeriopsis navalis LEGE 11480]